MTLQMISILVFVAVGMVPTIWTINTCTLPEINSKEPFNCLTCNSIYKHTRTGLCKSGITVISVNLSPGMAQIEEHISQDECYHVTSDAAAEAGSPFEVDTLLQGENIQCCKHNCHERCYAFIVDHSYKTESCTIERRNHSSNKNGILVFEKIAYADAGLYSFRNGKEASAVLIHVTNDGSEKQAQDVDFVSKKAGENVTLKCAWKNSTVVWKKNDLTLDNRTELTLENLDISHNGEYICVICYNYSICKSHKFILSIDDNVESASLYTWALVPVVGLLIITPICSIAIIMKRINMFHANNSRAKFSDVLPVTENVDETELTPIVQIESQRRRAACKADSKLYYELPVDMKWEFSRERLIISSELGEGEFGKVFKAEALGIIEGTPGPTTVAVKMLREEALTDGSVKNFICELDIMKVIGKHPNIINLLGCCAVNGPLYVIVEYAPHGDLRNFLRMHRPVQPNEESALASEPNNLSNQQLISFALQIAQGMEYLASQKCVHRDLAARNVLVAENYVMKISDFGMARDVLDQEYYRKPTNEKIAMRWMAPESMLDRFFNSQSDVWSYGVLLWEIMTFGDKPYVGWVQLYQQLRSGERLDQPESCPDNVYQLMTECWQFKAQNRPTFSEIVQKLEEITTTVNNTEALEQ